MILRRTSLRRAAHCLAFACAVAAIEHVHAYEIEHVVANGGTTISSGGSYVLSGTIGQPVAGPASSGPVTLEAGFWLAASPLADALFSDGFEGTP